MVTSEAVYTNVSLTTEDNITHNMFNDYCHVEIPTTDEEAELAKRIQSGDKQAEHELTTRNMRLVVNIAGHFQGKGLDMADLVQEGSLGLMKAVKKFDPSRGCKFATMATYWIKQQIGRAICDQGNTIRYPVHVHDVARVVSKHWYREAQLNGEFPTTREIVAISGIDPRLIEAAVSALRIQPKSLDVEFKDDEETTFSDCIEDRTSLTPEAEFDLIELRDKLGKLLTHLDEKERRIIKMRFGWDDGIRKTLQEVADVEGLTRERIRQIENKAIGKLKIKARHANFEEWL